MTQQAQNDKDKGDFRRVKKRWKTNILFGIVLILLLFLTACDQAPDATSSDETSESGKITVYTSVYPLYDFAGKIAGDRAEVINLVPPGSDSHDFEPTPKDLVRLSEADVFIYIGGGFEIWIDDVLHTLDTSSMTVVPMSDHVHLLPLEEANDHEHEEDHDGDNGHSHGNSMDPHIWLDPLRAKEMAEAIKDALIERDEDGKEMYEANFSALATELDRLHEEYQQAVQNAARKEIIVSHAAFGYLADRYGLEQIAISGLSPSEEPSQKELQEIIALAEKHDVRYILFETLAMPKMANVVKEQIGAQALTLNPLEGLTKEEIAEEKDYFSVMRDNLESLKKALGSQS